MSSNTHFETIWGELSKTSFFPGELKPQLNEAFTKAQLDVESSIPFGNRLKMFWEEMDKCNYGFSESFKDYLNKLMIEVIKPASVAKVSSLEKKEIKAAAAKTLLYQNLAAVLSKTIGIKSDEKETQGESIPHLKFLAPTVKESDLKQIKYLKAVKTNEPSPPADVLKWLDERIAAHEAAIKDVLQENHAQNAKLLAQQTVLKYKKWKAQRFGETDETSRCFYTGDLRIDSKDNPIVLDPVFEVVLRELAGDDAVHLINNLHIGKKSLQRFKPFINVTIKPVIPVAVKPVIPVAAKPIEEPHVTEEVD